MTHQFILNSGGYFYRLYPKIKDMFEDIEANLYGQFVWKGINRKDFIIHLSDSGEINIRNTTIGREDKLTVHSTLEIIVPPEIYKYPFIEGSNYLLTYDKVIPLKEFKNEPKQPGENKLKSVYRDLSKKYHPDTENGNTVAMQVINEMYNRLKS